MHPLIPAVDLPVNVLLQGWLLLGATLRSCILTEALRHHDEQQRRNNVYPLDTTKAPMHTSDNAEKSVFGKCARQLKKNVKSHVF